MDDITVHILTGLTVAVALAAIVIIIVTSEQARGHGRNYDLGLLLGISWILGGLAATNLVVGILGLILLVYCMVKKRK